MIVFVFIAIVVGCRHRYRNGRQWRDNNLLTINGNGDGRRDSDATATAIEGATEMQQRQWQRRWMARQSDGGGSNGRYDDCNGRLATATMDRDSATAAQQQQRWKA
jgi:hypothetical protein